LDGIEGIQICWDMGHGVMNSLRYGLPKDPPEGFVQRVGHVHLHDITKGRDHHPLLYGHTPYRKYLRRLKHAGFDGTINLELSASGINRAGQFSQVLGACVHKVLKAWHEG
ncbi:MAG TPA: TIM barrel protein, partial [Chroococcales cyanobacterium]